MRLRILLPTDIFLDDEVAKIVCEAGNGAFCLLPRHIDFVAALVPGVLSYVTPDGIEHYVAIDEGTLVKVGRDVLISVLDAVGGVGLDELQAQVGHRFRRLDEDERDARSALARLEAGALRRLYELERERRV
jgi:F-type H+-transporting ATPase subunit epsilon